MKTKFVLETVLAITLIAILGGTAPIFLLHQAYALRGSFPEEFIKKVPVAISGDNIYLTWSSNKTGNDEVMFKASTDSGKTFGEKMNLSNTPNSDSQDAQIAAAGNNVYITWWERNQTSNEHRQPFVNVSFDIDFSLLP